jgi:prophage antirepressor-like protein
MAFHVPSSEVVSPAARRLRRWLSDVVPVVGMTGR